MEHSIRIKRRADEKTLGASCGSSRSSVTVSECSGEEENEHACNTDGDGADGSGDDDDGESSLGSFADGGKRYLQMLLIVRSIGSCYDRGI